MKSFIKYLTFEDSDFNFFPNESFESINNDIKKDMIKRFLVIFFLNTYQLKNIKLDLINFEIKCFFQE